MTANAKFNRISLPNAEKLDTQGFGQDVEVRTDLYYDPDERRVQLYRDGTSRPGTPQPAWDGKWISIGSYESPATGTSVVKALETILGALEELTPELRELALGGDRPWWELEDEEARRREVAAGVIEDMQRRWVEDASPMVRYQWMAADYYAQATPGDVGVTAWLSDDQLTALAEKEVTRALPDCALLVDDVRQHLALWRRGEREDVCADLEVGGLGQQTWHADKLSRYGTVRVALDEYVWAVACVIGVPSSDVREYRESGGQLDMYLSAWFVEAEDWSEATLVGGLARAVVDGPPLTGVPKWMVQALQEKLSAAAPALWREWEARIS